MNKMSIKASEVNRIREELERILPQTVIREHAKSTGFIKRNRTVDAVTMFLSILICFGTQRLEWLTQLHRLFCSLSIRGLRYKPFHNQLRKPEFSDWLRELFSELLTRTCVNHLRPKQQHLKHFEDIVIHDGSSFGLKDSLSEPYPGRFTKTTPAAVEIHVTTSLNGTVPQQVTLAADKEAEVAFRPTVESLSGKLLLADRMFEDRDYFRDIDANGGKYVVRGKCSIKPTIVSAYDKQGRRQKNLEGKRLCLKNLKGKDYDLTVEWKCSGKSVVRERICLFYRRGKKNKKEFMILHTNLPREAFSPVEIHEFYRYRWQVELFFKECKSYANLHKFDTGIKEIAEALIWASLCAAVYKRALTFSLEKVLRVEFSTMKVAANAFVFLKDLLLACVTEESKKITRQITALIEFMKTHCRATKHKYKKNSRQKIGLRYSWYNS